MGEICTVSLNMRIVGVLVDCSLSKQSKQQAGMSLGCFLDEMTSYKVPRSYLFERRIHVLTN